MISNASYPILVGPNLDKGKAKDKATSTSSFVSVKSNLKPPSIRPSIPGYLHSPSKYDSHWLLEYDASAGDEGQRGGRNSVYGFVGAQTAAKDVDCILIWDDKKQCYTLERLASSFTLRIDRSHSKLSEKAKTGLTLKGRTPSDRNHTSALGLNLSGDQETAVDVEMLDENEGEGDRDDEDDFARQLELDLEVMTEDEGKPKTSSEEGLEHLHTSQKLRTGLGLIDNSILRDDVITPRCSPYIDRPKNNLDNWGGSKSTPNQLQSHSAIQAANANARSTPVVSPTSVTNSPRMNGLDSTLSSSNVWKPPPQRSNVSIAYDEEEEESDEEEEEDDEDDDDEEEDGDGEDDEDLEDYARQLESSLQS